jgi:hypothetical protein
MRVWLMLGFMLIAPPTWAAMPTGRAKRTGHEVLYSLPYGRSYEWGLISPTL